MYSATIFVCVVFVAVGSLTAQGPRGGGGRQQEQDRHEPGGRFGPGGNGGGHGGGRPNFGPFLPFFGPFPPFFGLFPGQSQQSIPPIYIGVFQSDPKVDSQVNLNELYSEAFSNSLLRDEIVNLNISRNGSVYQLEETVISSSTSTTLQSVSFQLGVLAQVLLNGAVAEVIASVNGGNQLVLTYNSTISGTNGLTSVVYSAGKFGGLNANYHVGNTTGSRQFHRV